MMSACLVLLSSCARSPEQPVVVGLDSMAVAVDPGFTPSGDSYWLSYHRDGKAVLRANPGQRVPSGHPVLGRRGVFTAAIDSGTFASLERSISGLNTFQNPDTTEFYSIDGPVTVVTLASGPSIWRLFESRSDSVTVRAVRALLDSVATHLHWTPAPQ